MPSKVARGEQRGVQHISGAAQPVTVRAGGMSRCGQRAGAAGKMPPNTFLSAKRLRDPFLH